MFPPFSCLELLSIPLPLCLSHLHLFPTLPFLFANLASKYFYTLQVKPSTQFLKSFITCSHLLYSVLWNQELSTVVTGEQMAIYGAVHNYTYGWVCQVYDDGIINGYWMFLQLLFVRYCSCNPGHITQV